MSELAAIDHLLGFFVPAFGVAALAAAFCKLLWRRMLRDVSWLRLASWGAAASSAAWLGGLVAFGRDGMMASYGAMLLANAIAIWCVAFGPARR